MAKRDRSDSSSSNEQNSKKVKTAPESDSDDDAGNITETESDFLGEDGEPFLRIRQGHGQLYETPYDATLTEAGEIHHIGTVQLNTCLAIYFKVDDDWCFFAHANFEIRNSDGTKRKRNETDPDKSYALVKNDHVENQIVDKVKFMLNDMRKHALEEEPPVWGGLTTETISETMRNSLLLASPTAATHSHLSGDRYIADVIAETVREWMGIPANRVHEFPIHNAERLIVRHPIENRDNDVIWLGNDLEKGKQRFKIWLDADDDQTHFGTRINDLAENDDDSSSAAVGNGDAASASS